MRSSSLLSSSHTCNKSFDFKLFFSWISVGNRSMLYSVSYHLSHSYLSPLQLNFLGSTCFFLHRHTDLHHVSFFDRHHSSIHSFFHYSISNNIMDNYRKNSVIFFLFFDGIQSKSFILLKIINLISYCQLLSTLKTSTSILSPLLYRDANKTTLIDFQKLCSIFARKHHKLNESFIWKNF